MSIALCKISAVILWKDDGKWQLQYMGKHFKKPDVN
jgi:hypothetical protein